MVNSLAVKNLVYLRLVNQFAAEAGKNCRAKRLRNMRFNVKLFQLSYAEAFIPFQRSHLIII